MEPSEESYCAAICQNIYDAHQPHPYFTSSPVLRIFPFLAHGTKNPDATLGLGCAADGLNAERDGAVWIEYYPVQFLSA